MRRMILPLMLVVVACQPAAMELTDAEKAAIADDVNAITAEFFDVWRAADWERGMTYYYDSPEMVWAWEGVIDYGYAEVDAKYRPGFASVASQTFDITDSRTTVLSRDVVLFTATMLWSQTDTAGLTGPEMHIAWTGVWVLRDGAWKVQHAHTSQPPPEAESL